MDISIVIPLFNEENRFTIYFPKLKQHLYKFFINKSYEIIIVNDGSLDNTRKVVQDIQKYDKKVKLIDYKTNHGKGYALKKGILASKGKYIIFTDIDLSTDIKNIKKMVDLLTDNQCDIVITSRRLEKSNLLIRQPILRETMGKVFTWFAKLLLRLNHSDLTCGLKIGKKNAFIPIFNKMLINRWGYDAEMLYLAKRYHYKVIEIPTEWKNNNNSKVNIILDPINSFLEIIYIIINNFQGKY